MCRPDFILVYWICGHIRKAEYQLTPQLGCHGCQIALGGPPTGHQFFAGSRTEPELCEECVDYEIWISFRGEWVLKEKVIEQGRTLLSI